MTHTVKDISVKLKHEHANATNVSADGNEDDDDRGGDNDDGGKEEDHDRGDADDGHGGGTTVVTKKGENGGRRWGEGEGPSFAFFVQHVIKSQLCFTSATLPFPVL
jgi:hypothetical protein